MPLPVACSRGGEGEGIGGGGDAVERGDYGELGGSDYLPEGENWTATHPPLPLDTVAVTFSGSAHGCPGNRLHRRSLPSLSAKLARLP